MKTVTPEGVTLTVTVAWAALAFHQTSFASSVNKISHELRILIICVIRVIRG